MPKRDPDLLVEDMLEALRKIELYIAGMDHSSFLQDEKTIDAIVRNLEVLGEAARQVPDDFAARHRSVPWQKITGLRNRIVHDYFGLDLEITGADVWAAYDSTMEAAERVGRKEETLERIRKLASGFVLQVLERQLGV